MNNNYSKQILIIIVLLISSLSIVLSIKSFWFSEHTSSNVVMKNAKEKNNELKYRMATTKEYKKEETTTMKIEKEKIELAITEEEQGEYPYSVAPEIIDDGSIIYDGMTVTELTNKLNKSLNSYMTNTGYFFADFTRRTGLDPYLSVAIVMLETGCKWSCSTLTKECNNIGGLKGGKTCGNRQYSKYDTLEEGISSYLNIIYNNYYLKGMTTPETMASTYAASSTWAQKVNSYIRELKEN